MAIMIPENISSLDNVISGTVKKKLYKFNKQPKKKNKSLIKKILSLFK